MYVLLNIFISEQTKYKVLLDKRFWK